MARIDDGFPTLLSFSEDSAVLMWEKTVTPPGVDGGGENDTSTMRNTIWRTRAPKGLITLSPGGGTVAYDPDVLTNIIAMVNVNQEITVTFPDASTWTFWGWINTFVPGEITEGEQPTAELEIIPSNQNSDGAEAGPTVA